MSGLDYREVIVRLPYELLPWQRRVKADRHRNIAIVAGRRSGKTHFLIDKEIEAATTFAAGLPCWYVAPTYGMAKDIAWALLKEFTRDLYRAKIIKRYYETELRADFITGAQIHLKGADNVDSLRGRGLGFLGIDEMAIMKPEIWDEVLRPSVADKKAPVVFIGTPKGYNHFYRLSAMETTDPMNWKTYHIKTSEAGTISPEELEKAHRDMEERAYRQEFEASFETFGGQVFSDFDRKKHVAEKPIDFIPTAEYALGQDFGWSSPTAVLFINVLPNEDVQVFGELGRTETSIPQISLDIKNRTRGLGRDQYGRPVDAVPSLIGCDPAGDSRSESLGTSSVEELRNIFGYKTVCYRRNYPGIIQDGINQIRKWLRNGKLKISPTCTNLIQAFEMYRYPDPKGDIQSEQPLKDGISDHWIDALRYFFLNRFPVQQTTVRAI